MPRHSRTGFSGITVKDLWKERGQSGRRWFVRVRYPDGHRETVTYADEPGLTDKKVAERANQERARVLDGRQTLAAGDLRQLGTRYVAVLRSRNRNESYAKHIEQVVNALGAKRITDVKSPEFRSQVEEWIGGLKANWWARRDYAFRRTNSLVLSGSLKNRVLRELRSVLNYAVESGILVVNPLQGIKTFAIAKKQKPIPSVEEVASLVSNKMQTDPWWLPFCLLAYTGCRVEEAMHLEWGDIDLKAGLIHIRHKPEIYKLKGQRERSLPFQAELRSILTDRFRTTGFLIVDEHQRTNGSDQHLRTKQEPRKRKKTPSPDYVGPFRRYLLRAGLIQARADELSPHSLRHWYICAQLASGTAFDDVMEWVGHSQASTTLGYRGLKSQIAKAVSSWPRGDFHLRRPVSIANQARQASN